MHDSAVEARVARWGRGIAIALPVDWLVRRYGEVPRELELLCGGRRVRLRLVSVTSASARYYVRGAGQLAVMEAGECVPAR
ncbi:MAG: hypothetical protein LM577_09015 [Thermoproteaceae archaeon]|jgi:hypothetical protein|nr:hypothetical protein [Thermoproteaceae archaeon]